MKKRGMVLSVAGGFVIAVIAAFTFFRFAAEKEIPQSAQATEGESEPTFV